MATTNGLTARRAAVAGSVAAVVVFSATWLLWWGRPPQLGANEEVLKAVDALFTAVTARNEKLLGECGQRLHTLKVGGKLSSEASDYLEGIVDTARAGRWQSAAERLYSFMKAQRREGPPERHTKEEKGRRASVRN
jgi:hypothetical protein